MFSSRPSLFILSLGVFLLAALSTLPFLHQFEFLRHTEADRTLIAWELLQTHSWFAPSLFGDLYLTKPPLYYWVLASVFSACSNMSEALARLPSALASCLLVLAFFLFLLKSSFPLRLSLLGAFALLSSAEFFRYASKAEMDMFYSCLCGLALFFGYFANISPRWFFSSLAAGVCVGLAFLTKGPPIFVFYGSALIGLFLFQLRSKTPLIRILANMLQRNILPALIPLGLLAVWIAAMHRASIGSEDLAFQFREELVRRFVDDSEGNEAGNEASKAWWYYLLHLPAGLLPWTIIALFGAYFLRKQRVSLLQAVPAPLRAYALGALGISLLIFSLSSGKSTRYLLPLFPLFLCLLLPSLAEAWTSLSKKLFKRSDEAAFLKLLALGFVFLLVLRLASSYLYAPYANQQRSAKPALAFVQEKLQGKQDLYVLEVFERWLPYYFIREGGRVHRMTPTLTQNLRNSPEDIFVFLNAAEESWRLTQLTSKLPHAILEKHEFSIYKHNYLLVRIPASSAWAFEPKEKFPTAPSKIPAAYRH